MNLSMLERLMLINQYSIRMSLEPENKEHFGQLITILSEGYECFYDDMFNEISPQPVTDEDTSFVMDTLDMYRAIADYISANPNDSEVTSHSFARFSGFCGNTEGSLLGFTQFVIKTRHLYEEQLAHERHGFNSHMPISDIYGRMLATWRDSGSPHELSRDQVVSILSAAKRGG